MLRSELSSKKNIKKAGSKESGVVHRSWGSTNELVGILNKDCPPCLGALFKGEVETAVSTYFNCKQHFDKLNQE